MITWKVKLKCSGYSCEAKSTGVAELSSERVIDIMCDDRNWKISRTGSFDSQRDVNYVDVTGDYYHVKCPDCK